MEDDTMAGQFAGRFQQDTVDDQKRREASHFCYCELWRVDASLEFETPRGQPCARGSAGER